MAWLGSIASSVIRNIVSVEHPPNQVIEVKLDHYISRRIYCREDSLVLYYPDDSSQKRKYEILLYKPFTESIDYAYR